MGLEVFDGAMANRINDQLSLSGSQSRKVTPESHIAFEAAPATAFVLFEPINGLADGLLCCSQLPRDRKRFINKRRHDSCWPTHRSFNPTIWAPNDRMFVVWFQCREFQIVVDCASSSSG